MAAMSETTAIRITLPIPPSVNHLYKNAGKRGRVATDVYTRLADARWSSGEAIQQPPDRRPLCRLSRAADVNSGRRRHLLKAPIDLLVSLGITPDDSLLQGVVAWRHEAIKAGSCEVLVDAVAA